jgi:AAHS family 4-hydroxybenzoate transporter-like MFS transporter
MGTPASPLQALIDAGRITPVQIRAVLLCTLVTLAEGVDLNLIPLLAPAIARDWALPSSAFGAIFSSGPVGLIIGGFTIGWIADLIGRRGALIVAMIVMTLATFATAFARDVPELLVCRILTGIGFGGVVPAAAALVSEFMPTRTRASTVSFVILGQALGGFLASLGMQTTIGALHWQSLILYMSLLCGVTTLILFVTLPESPRYLLLRDPAGARTKSMLARLRLTEIPAPEADSRTTGRGNLAALFQGGRALGTLLIWAFFIGVCAEVSFFTSWLTLIFTYAGQSQLEAVRVNSAYWLGGIVAGLVLPLFALRWHVNRVLLAAILCGAVCTAALGITIGGGARVNLVLGFACGVFASGSFYLLYPPAVRFYPTEIRSTGVGSAVAFGRIGNVLSPLAASLLLEAKFAPATVIVAMALPMLFSAGALAVFHARENWAGSA